MTRAMTSGICNTLSVIYVDSTGLPNDENTLHEDLKEAGKYVIPYCQKVRYNENVVHQVVSSVASIPTCLAKHGGITLVTLTGSLVNTVVGDEGTRYYFNYTFTANNTYYQKKCHLEFTQGTEVMKTEPFWTDNLDEDIANGRIKKIEYTNFDRINGDLKDYTIDWNSLMTTDKVLSFYIESSVLKVMNSDEREILEESNNKDIISASLFKGFEFTTGGIPQHMVIKLQAASNLDFFAINGIEFIKSGEFSPEPFGNSTSFQVSGKVEKKNNIGINVDNTNFEITMSGIVYTYADQYLNVTTGFSVAPPAGYDLHYITAKHSVTSSGNTATIKAGTTNGGEDIIASTDGEIDQIIKSFSFAQHFHPTGLFIGISGASVKLDISVAWIYTG
jgi:hypothetical protein